MTWYALPDGLDWLLAPVKAGMCRYESLKDGTLGLEDVAVMNDMLALSVDNEQLAREHAERNP